MKLPWHWKIEQQVTTIDDLRICSANSDFIFVKYIGNVEASIVVTCCSIFQCQDNDSYGIWYLDSLDHLERYEGKKVSFVAMVLKPGEFPKGYFVPGRMAMTCCAEDMAFLGFACEYDRTDQLKEKQWVKVTRLWIDRFHIALITAQILYVVTAVKDDHLRFADLLRQQRFHIRKIINNRKGADTI